MEKKRLFRIMAKADRTFAIGIADKIKETEEITIVKEPEKVLAMIKMREPVKQSLFYLGEVIVTEAAVSIGGANGVAVLMGDDYEKTASMAIIDAAFNSGVLQDETPFWEMEEQLLAQEEKENALFQKTMVDFNTMA